jgi:plastocyanin
MRLGGLITIAVAGALAAPAHAQTADATVQIGNNAFSPAEVTITQGQVVNWVWTGPDKDHSTTTGAEGQTTWDSAPGDPTPQAPDGDRFSKEFQFEGEFAYFCKTHSFMTGRVIVTRRETHPFAPTPDTVRPRFGTPRFSVSRRLVAIRLNEPAEIEAKLRGPTRRTLKKRQGKLGRNVVRIPKRLRAGRYALVMRATDAAGNRSLGVRVKFRIR